MTGMQLEIRQLHPLFVGEISDLDAGHPITPAAVRAISDAIDLYAVRVLRNQKLDDDRQLAFARHFGKIEAPRSSREGTKPRLRPEMSDISNLDENQQLRAADDPRRFDQLGRFAGGLGCIAREQQSRGREPRCSARHRLFVWPNWFHRVAVWRTRSSASGRAARGAPPSGLRAQDPLPRRAHFAHRRPAHSRGPPVAARPDRIRHPAPIWLQPCLAQRRSCDLGQSLHDASRPAVRRERTARPAPGDNARRGVDTGPNRLRVNPMSSQITLEMLKGAGIEDFPVVDLEDYLRGKPGALDRVARQLRDALEHIGFLIVVNHGVAAELIDGIVEQARRFHAMPLVEKIKIETKRGADSGFTGYLPSGEYVIKTSELNNNDKPDLNAAFFMDQERSLDDPEVMAGKLFRAPNKCPQNLPGFREFLLRYWDALEGFSRRMLPTFAAALELP